MQEARACVYLFIVHVRDVFSAYRKLAENKPVGEKERGGNSRRSTGGDLATFSFPGDLFNGGDGGDEGGDEEREEVVVRRGKRWW